MTVSISSDIVLGADAGESVQIDGLGVRFMVGAGQTGGRFALVEHPIAPRSIAAGIHIHAREDEFSYVLEGTVGVQVAGEIRHAGPGDLVLKPRGVPHAFWNPGDAPARLLEIISPGGMEELFREVADAWNAPEPDLARFDDITRRYAIDFDIDSEAWIPIREGFADGGGEAVPEQELGPAPGPFVVGAADGEALDLGGFGVRYITAGEGFALVEHLIAPRTLAVPLHVHTLEDEFSYVLEGEVGFQVGEQVRYAGPGELVSKPRGVAHAFWNRADRPARVLELVSPGGFEDYFREIAPLLPPHAEQPDIQGVAAVMARYGLTMDFDSIATISAREGLPLPA